MDFETEAEFQSEELEEFLDRIQGRVNSIEEGDRILGGIVSVNVFRDIMAHFDQEEGPEGQWQEWSPSYTEYMQAGGKGNNRLLQDTGRLRQSFLPTNFKSVRSGIVFFNPAKTKDGFPYAAAHDEGGGQLPQREFMWLSDIGMEEASKSILTWLASDDGGTRKKST
jgi:hypothetical protein